jgi:segregation and condensation protein A
MVDDRHVDDRYKVNLGNLFEGPMDLLVHLIRKNQVNIYDVPIALITDQYLAYIQMLQDLNIDVAGEFILMAATLTHIKSRMLLPVHETEDGEAEDPRSEITGPLIEYLQMKSAAGVLAQRQYFGDSTFKRPSRMLPEDLPFIEPGLIQVGLFELIDAFKRILDNLSDIQRLDFSMEQKTVKDRMTEIIEILEEKGSVTFGELFSVDVTRFEVVITFLAVLEMVKLALIRIVQHAETGIIRLFYQ